MPNLFQTFLNKIQSGYTQLRDKIAVPAIDSGMAAGIIPASAGMFGRYLTGTSKPLTKAPADIRKAESWRAQAMPNPNNYIADDQSVGVYHRDGSTETKPFPKEAALSNSLGRYVKQNGVVLDRYNFDDYDQSGVFSMTGGIEGANKNLENAAQYMGKLAGKFGLIKPGSGYDVKLNLPYQPKPDVENYKNISQNLSQRLNKEGENLSPETIKLYRQHNQLEQELKNKGIRVGLN